MHFPMVLLRTSCFLQRRGATNRVGATMAMVILLLPIVLLFAAFAVNATYIELVRTELQIRTDVACRAGGRTLLVTGSEAAAIAVAQELAGLNPVAGKVVPVTAADVEFGISVRPNASSVYQFSPRVDDNAPMNALRLTTQSLNSGTAGITLKPILPIFGSSLNIRTLRSAVSTQVDLDIALVVDRSGSMIYAADEVSENFPILPATAPAGWEFGDPVPPGARWLDTVAAVQIFLAALDATPQQELVSLSTYSHNTSTEVMLTDQYGDILAALISHSAAFHGGGTNIGGGIYEGLACLLDPATRRTQAVPVLIVLTDGRHNYGVKPTTAANVARHNKVTVYTITFSDEADLPKMQSAAQIGGGRHYHAINASELNQAFRDIANKLPILLTQ